MNFSAFARKLFPPRARMRRASLPQPAIEILEPRIAPATLVNPTTVTFQDKTGDAVTVTISKPLFTSASVGSVFTFDTGSVNGDNSAHQQLELLNITALGTAASGMDISITAQPVNGSPGVVNVGYINAAAIDLGNVTVGGDLGRIAVGDTNYSTPGLQSLTVQSLGLQGLATQAAGGNLNSLFAGPIGSITVNGGIFGASIGIGGGSQALLGSLTVSGSIHGGAAANSGSIQTQGGITSVVVDGSISGGGGAGSGVIGTTGALGTVYIGGSVTGGAGASSGAILSSGAIQSIQIHGNLAGGSGKDSGQLGTASTLGSVIIGGSVSGAAGVLSGAIEASGNIASVTIARNLTGGHGANSGDIGTAGALGAVTVKGSVAGGAGVFSGAILSTQAMGTVHINGNLTGGSGNDSGQVGTASNLGAVGIDGSVTGGLGTLSGAILASGNGTSVTIKNGLNGGAGADSGQIGIGKSVQVIGIGGGSAGYQGIQGGSGASSGTILVQGGIGAVDVTGNITGLGNGSGAIDAGGAIQTVEVTGGVDFGGIFSGASLGAVTIDGSLTNGSEIHAHLSIGAVSVNPLGPGSLPATSGPGIVNSSILADNGSIGAIIADGAGSPTAYAISDASIAAGGSIGPIDARAFNQSTFAIIASEVVAGGSLGNVTAMADNGTAICSSHFQAARGIGAITGTASNLGGGAGIAILNSTFQAGAGIAGIAASSGNGGDIVSILNSGFNAAGSIGAIRGAGSINGSVFIAGIDLGPNFAIAGAGTFDKASAAAMGFGPGKPGFDANIGAVTVTGGFIAHSTFLAGVHGAGADLKFGTRDDAVAAGSSIGAISSQQGLNTVFVEAGDIGATTTDSIVHTTYLATDTPVSSAGIGAITVVAAIGGSQSSAIANEGIADSNFSSNAGIGDINVTIGGIRSAGENAGIASSTFLAGHALAKITVTDAASGSAGSNYGIVDTVFNAGVSDYGGIGDINVTLTFAGAAVHSAAIASSDFDASYAAGFAASMGSISAESYGTAASASGILDSVFRVDGTMGNISATMDSGLALAAGIQGSVFSAFGSIGEINVYGAVLSDSHSPSRFLAGYDIGSDMTFGNENLAAGSAALQAGQSIGNVLVTGYFSGSDIAASVNPGAGYVFGASDNTNVGAGGSIGLVVLGANFPMNASPFAPDHAEAHAIEAATFALGAGTVPSVSVFGNTCDIPTVLYVDGGILNVRITEVA